MSKVISSLTASLFAGFFLLGCSSDNGNPSSLDSMDLDIQPGTGLARIQLQEDACVSLLAGQSIVAGTVCSSIQGDSIQVTYATIDGWLLYQTHLWAGLNLAQMPQTNNGNPKVGLFPYVSPSLSGVTSYSVKIPLSIFGLADSMTSCADVSAIFVSHAVVKKTLSGGTTQSETAYGEGTRLVQKGNWATWFNLQLSCVADKPPVVGSCETAFAHDSEQSICFIGSGLLQTNRWGWTNGPLVPGSYTFEIYAGAGQCDLSKGALVGSLSVDFDGSVAQVQYNMLPGFIMDETHLYVGSEPLPRNGTEYTVAPGQYGNIHNLTTASSDSYSIAGLTSPVYVVAHAVTCSVN